MASLDSASVLAQLPSWMEDMSTIINLQMEVLARMSRCNSPEGEHRDEIFRFGPRGRADRPSFQQPPRPRDGERRRDGERSDGASASLASISEADEAAEAETDGSLKAPMAPAKSREREGSSLRRNEKERDGGRQRLPPHADSAPVEWNLLPVSEQSEGDGISYERRICESVVIEKEGFCPSGLINPHWIGKLVWDFGVMFCVLMDAMVLPFQLTFKSNLGADSFDTVWLWTTTWIFGIDIIFSFNCAIESEDGVHGAKSKLILDRVKIAKSYLRGWFAIDFGSTVPWAQLSEAWLSGGSSSQLTRLTKVVKFVRLLRLVRMLRLAKLGQIWERVEHRIGSLFLLQCISLLRVLSVVVAMCHWSACLFWLIGLPRNIFTDVFFSEDEQQAYEAAPHWTTIWRHHDAVETSWRWLDRSTSETYVFCFYWTLGVMRTMPAEVTPVNLPERVFVLIFMFFALSAFAISIALITQSFFKLSERKKAFNEEYAAVRLHLQRTKVSEDIQFRVKSYLKYLFDQRKTHAKEATLLNSLPDELKDQVFRCQALHHMMRLPNMQHFRRSHRLRLAAAAATCDFMPGQALVKRNDPIEASWILISGQLHKDGWNVDEYPTVVHAECLEPHGHEPLLSDCQVVATEVSEVLRVDKATCLRPLDGQIAPMAYNRGYTPEPGSSSRAASGASGMGGMGGMGGAGAAGGVGAGPGGPGGLGGLGAFGLRGCGGCAPLGLGAFGGPPPAHAPFAQFPAPQAPGPNWPMVRPPVAVPPKRLSPHAGSRAIAGMPAKAKESEAEKRSERSERSESSSASARESSSTSSEREKRKKKKDKKDKKKGRKERSRSRRKNKSSSSRPRSVSSSSPREDKAEAPQSSEVQQATENAKREVLQQLEHLKKVEPKEQRMKEWRSLLRSWHPDKNPDKAEVATAVFQFLQKGKLLLGL